MKTAATAHRKLIDLKPAVFDALSLEAARQGIPLKKYIENLLEQASPRQEVAAGTGISRLIGSARPDQGDLSALRDDRLQYLLSK